MAHQILIRRSRSRACIAHWEATETGDVRLLRVTPDTGPAPDVAHLLDEIFPDVAALRRAVLAAMRGPVGDTLDRVLLARSAYDRWQAVAAEAARNRPGLDPARIPDERARAISGGRLLIWVDLPAGEKVSLILERDEWAWRTPEH